MTSAGQPRLTVIPVTLRQANAYVGMWHRHHNPARGCVCCLAVMDEDQSVRGVAIVGRPLARMLHDGRTCEVLRVATDGCANAPSCLYGAARRAARELGYLRVVTYTLGSEPGTSLHAAGYVQMGLSRGGTWSRRGRLRRDKAPLEAKQVWMALMGGR